MATFTFDGTTSVTASKDDTVLITANPQSFTQATDNGNSVTLRFGAQTLTVTGATFADNQLPNVFVPGGNFAYSNSLNTLGNGEGNTLAILGQDTAYATGTTTADSKLAIFGGLGRSDSIDNADSITIGGKGSFLVFGNAGADTINQGTAFDSTSTVSVTGGIGNDIVTFGGANTKASIFVGGEAGTDSITIVNSGSTFIQGGIDSTDGADTITFNGLAGGAAGTSTIFGNGGADSITVGGTNNLDSTSTTTVFGGFGDDKIAVTAAAGAKATISALGGEGADSITITGFGNTFITGGNQSGDQSLDSADTIAFTGSGSTLIYGNAGADQITATLNTADTTNISIYGGKDGDTITQTAAGAGKATVFIAGNEGSDVITAAGNGGAVTVFGGNSSSDATDAADTINYSAGSTGQANIFGNGGADVVNVGALGNDTTTATANVSGGGANDTINVAAQAANSQTLVLSGNEGSDTFAITQGKGASVGITDFAVGTDKLTLDTAGTPGSALQVVAQTFQTLQTALDAAANAADGAASKAAAVVFSGSTYVVLSGGTAGFAPADDQAIKLTGVTDLVGLVGSTTIA